MFEVKIKYLDGNVNVFTASGDEVEAIFDNIDDSEYDNVKSVIVSKLWGVRMKILKIILLIVYTFWLFICTAYSNVALFNKPISYIVSALSGALIGYYSSRLLKEVLEDVW